MKKRPKGLFFVKTSQSDTKDIGYHLATKKSIHLSRQTSPIYLIVTNSSEPVG